MRWENIKPQVGDSRTRFVFAWLPTEVENHTVWLEKYYVYEVFKNCYQFDSWVTIRKYLFHKS